MGGKFVGENTDYKIRQGTERYVHYHFQEMVTTGKLHSFWTYPTFYFNKNKLWNGQSNQFASDQ